MYGSGCWATRHEANEVGVACCTSGLVDFINFISYYDFYNYSKILLTQLITGHEILEE